MRRTPPQLTPNHSIASTLVVSVGVVGLLFGLMVAVSYPMTTVLVGIACAVTVAARRTIALLKTKDAVCIPGTEVCIRLASN